MKNNDIVFGTRPVLEAINLQILENDLFKKFKNS